jgi:uncharacterized damage-inducible protein DinB
MMAMTADELMAWNERTAEGWRSLAGRHPELLSFPCDVYETRNVGELLQHIVAVELRFAQRLHGLPESPYEEIPYDSAQAIYATHDEAMVLLNELLRDLQPSWWEETITFATRRIGTLQASRRTLLIHALMHSIRHYAQLATLVRQQGIKPDWSMDYLMMGATRLT